MTTEPRDWNQEAVEVANDYRKHWRDEPPGASQPLDDPKTAALFGNGETRYVEDRTARSAVELLRQRFDGLGVKELGFGLDSETESTWAIIVKSPGRVIDDRRVERLGQALKEAYRIACEQE